MGVNQILIINPRSDDEFVAFVEGRALAASTTAELQESLRGLHPRAIVRARDLSGETGVVWYVYRDGRWVAPNGGPHGGEA